MKPTISITDEKELKIFLDDLENRLEEIEVEKGETLWKKYIREPSGDLDEIERRRSEIILNDQYLGIVKRWKPKLGITFCKRASVR